MAVNRGSNTASVLLNAPGLGRTVTLSAGDVRQDLNFGNRSLAGELHGFVYRDADNINGQSTREVGLAGQTVGLIDLMFNVQVEAARAQANLLLKGRLHRIDIVASPGQFSLDNASPAKIEHLIQLGRGEAVKKANLDVVRSRFLNDTTASKFEPLFQC